MPNFQKNTSRVKASAFVDFKPAELKQSKDWLIVYYAKNPVSQKLERFRLRVPVIKDKRERLRHAQKIILKINAKLLNGWSPYFEETGKNYKGFTTAVEEFLKAVDKMISDNVMRADTKRSYNSNCNLLKLFVETKNQITFAVEINKKFCVEYLDWIYIDRNSSPVTRNNHLTFLKLFCSWLVQRGVLIENPATGIQRMKKPDKKRIAFNGIVKDKIKNYTNDLENSFGLVCEMTYYCLVRSSEMLKLKVSDVDINNKTIFIDGTISKNKKSEAVTIPNNFLKVLERHISNAEASDFIFSLNGFKAGKKQMPVRKITTEWEKLRKNLELGKEYQFYGLKDTGITDLLDSGVPAIKVRDHARHHDIRITEIYSKRRNTLNVDVDGANIVFGK